MIDGPSRTFIQYNSYIDCKTEFDLLYIIYARWRVPVKTSSYKYMYKVVTSGRDVRWKSFAPRAACSINALECGFQLKRICAPKLEYNFSLVASCQITILFFGKGVDSIIASEHFSHRFSSIHTHKHTYDSIRQTSTRYTSRKTLETIYV